MPGSQSGGCLNEKSSACFLLSTPDGFSRLRENHDCYHDDVGFDNHYNPDINSFYHDHHEATYDNDHDYHSSLPRPIRGKRRIRSRRLHVIFADDEPSFHNPSWIRILGLVCG